MTEQTDRILEEARQRLDDARTPDDIEQVRVDYLGRRGILADLFASIPELPPDQRPRH
mgnify:FL=1